ncbi:MAG: aminotransferase class V-fold PLP-dependent enzyme [Ilumatobacteraceae bacterium]
MPTFGSSMRSEWLLDPDLTYLNHGTVGATPRRVLAHQRAITDEIERHPARYMLRELADTQGTATSPRRLRVAAAAVAEFVGVAAEDLMFVDNITTGANAILRSFPFAAGDDIAVTNLGYGGVTNTAKYVARTIGGTLQTIELPQPGAAPGDFVAAIADGLGERTRVLIVDHITSGTALVLPLAEIAALCHERGVLVLADGAHVPGSIPVDIDSFGVDWYIANLHKWAWAPRSAGILWSAKQHQGYLHPTVISWGLDNGIAAEFDRLGTRDPSTFLAAPYAIELLNEFGGDDGVAAIYRYNHELAWWTGQYLADRWGTRFTTPEEMIGAMVNVRLPAVMGTTVEDAEQLRSDLDAAGIEVPVFAGPDQLTLRVCAQIYCDRADIEHLGDVVAKLAAN